MPHTCYTSEARITLYLTRSPHPQAPCRHDAKVERQVRRPPSLPRPRLARLSTVSRVLTVHQGA